MTVHVRTFPVPEAGDAAPAPARSAWRAGMWSLPEVRWATAATLLFAAGGICQLSGAPSWLWWGLYLICYAAGGWEPGLSGLKALRDKTLDVDLLMVVAAIGAAAIGQVFDGALLIVIFATSGALEAVATKRTADSVRGLLDLAPEQATRLSEAGGEERVCPLGHAGRRGDVRWSASLGLPAGRDLFLHGGRRPVGHLVRPAETVA
ncbi:hypothetical protein [Nonomuraea sp. NPDC052265]|uniref:hypothetical protein n=1 Tax=Nonomuraea sp. NPDC052265 TaxID=3364374 RepID=UPI0037C62A25